MSDRKVVKLPRVPVKFDEAIHPGIVKRMTVMERDPSEIASALGITLETYSRWLRDYPELEQARKRASHIDGVVINSLAELAAGWRNPDTGKVQAPNVAAAIFWAKARLGWSDQPPPPPPKVRVEDLAQDQLSQRARDLLGTVRRTESLAAPREEEDDDGEPF